MLITAVVTVLLTFMDIIVSLLPSYTPFDLSTDLAGFHPLSGTSAVNGLVFTINNYVPLDTVVTILGLMATFFVASLLYHFTIWVLTKLHVLGGSSE